MYFISLFLWRHLFILIGSYVVVVNGNYGDNPNQLHIEQDYYHGNGNARSMYSSNDGSGDGEIATLHEAARRGKNDDHHDSQQEGLTTSSLFSRPSAPLFQGNGYDFITLYLSLNQNDAKKEDRYSLLYPDNNGESITTNLQQKHQQYHHQHHQSKSSSNDRSSRGVIPNYELQMEERPRLNHTTNEMSITDSTASNFEARSANNYESYDDDIQNSNKSQEQESNTKSTTSSTEAMNHDTISFSSTSTIGQWSNCRSVGRIIPKSIQTNHFPVTVSIPNLSSEKMYRFRVRAVNNKHKSPWSLPSNLMETNLSIPKAPIHLNVFSVTSDTVQLKWKQNSYKPYADYFNVQYRKQLIDEDGGRTRRNEELLKGNQNSLHWIDHTDPKNIPSMMTLATPEVQEITTLVDDDSKITSGYFWLKLKVPYYDPTLRTNILESSTISKPIAFNASVESVEDAIGSIRGVENVRVFRYEPGRRGFSSLPCQGAYSWRIEFNVIGQHAPLFEIHRDTLDGTYSGNRYMRCQIRRLVKGKPPTYKNEIKTLVEGLESETYYEFRIRGGNSYGNGPWGDIMYGVKTASYIPPQHLPKPSKGQLSSPNVKLIPGIGRRAGNDNDADYLHGTSLGGLDKENGADGLVVVIQYNRQKMIIPSRTYFYFKGRSEHFKVPKGNLLKKDNNSILDVEYIDLKLWGGGGAGGGTPRNYSDDHQDGYSFGGGGGFVQTRIKVKPGDEFIIKVGSGGIYNHLDKIESAQITAGFLGGGKGGKSASGQYAGSGGGSTIVTRSDGKIIAVAGGGGGGGATDYCCAHGGEGGGRSGGNGKSPNTPLSIGEDDIAEGMKRREFTPQDCDDESCIDSRDIQGLPAFHKHFDRGFAPTASYDIQSEGGKGGSQIKPGYPGQSSGYDVMDNYLSLTALPGVRGFGGKGADGKEGGGGGGAGFMGGGGGGSGVDGSGGGGGSGYVDYSLVFVSNQKPWFIPERPMVISVSHNSFVIKWKTDFDALLLSVGDVVRAFTIEMSRGRIGAAKEGGKCSDDFSLIDTIPVDHFKREMSTAVEELSPCTLYCIRMIVVTDRIFSSRSEHVEIATMDLPKNEWIDIFPRENLDSMQNKQALDHADMDEMKKGALCEIPSKPAPRRGHSLTNIKRKIYLFGGVTDYCICTNAEDCDTKKIYSNEVWSFDVYTKIWKSLSIASNGKDSIPIGREKHSSTLLKNGKILIIGGRTDSSHERQVLNAPLFLGDVWEMDPGQVSHYSKRCIEDTQNITEGEVSMHPTEIELFGEPGFRQGDLCVKRLTIDIAIDHPCIEQIRYIALQRPEIFSNATTDRNAANEAKLFLSSKTEYESVRCTPMQSKITFSDEADRSILDFSSLTPREGSYRPAEDLRSHFYNNMVNGHWVLTIFDAMMDEKVGSLIDWKLNFELDYCSEDISWTKLSTNSNLCEQATIQNGKLVNNACNYFGRHRDKEDTFTPRHSHTSIAVGNDVFVVGGYDQGFKSEIWRFTYSTKTWVQLHDSLKRPDSIGQFGALTPYGLVLLGGIRTGISDSSLEKDIYIYNVLDRSQERVKVEFNISSRGYQPAERSFSSITYIGKNHFLLKEPLRAHSIKLSEAIVMFGGDIHLPQNNFLEDLWILTLEELQSSSSNYQVIIDYNRHHEACKDLLHPIKEELNYWDWSCGYLADVNSSLTCTWEEIVRKAWCLKQFQSFTSPL